MMLNKVNKTILLSRKLQNTLPKSALLIIYQTFIRPHLNSNDMIYDQCYNASFHQKLEPPQCNVCLAITGAITGISMEKLYEETCLESLQLSRWYEKPSCFYKLFNSEHPYYLFKLIPLISSGYVTRSMHNIPFFKRIHTFLKDIFLLSIFIEWSKLGHNMRN